MENLWKTKKKVLIYSIIAAQREFLNTADISQDPIENAICKYENHLRNICIKKSSMLSENT